ncbi:MAG TPA: type I phosphomannose isomerase catalytic subunit [Tepidisphaeraceae bacterium]|jgi:mannose-6-phosphate isomerase|nr:type I phosphomannose isomerase catalytic subunit [Tepidisphaeraceae bacterium]
MSLYPLKFHPRFVEKIWGGRKIETILNKKLPPGQMIGESWELYDFPPGVVEGTSGWVSAEVANGPLAGKTLHQLVEQFGSDLYGEVSLVGGSTGLTAGGQFPILIKFLDAREDLSIQVHPDDAYCSQNAGAYLKSEAWYVVQADEGSRILKGVVPGATKESLKTAIENGSVEQQVKSIAVKAGQCHYLPSGTLHALGAGILAAEVQTPSDTTFRVYDFNRIDATTGKPRNLHVEQALRCIDFSGKEPQQTRSHVAGFFTTVSRLVTSPYFKIEKVRMTEGVEEPVPYDQPVVWMMLEGEGQVKVADVSEPTTFKRGETVLLPAKMKNPIIKTTADCQWLEVTFPTRS